MFFVIIRYSVWYGYITGSYYNIIFIFIIILLLDLVSTASLDRNVTETYEKIAGIYIKDKLDKKQMNTFLAQALGIKSAAVGGRIALLGR